MPLKPLLLLKDISFWFDLPIQSIAQIKVSNSSQSSLPREPRMLVDHSPECNSLAASCNALLVASLSGRAKGGLHARSLVRSWIRKTDRGVEVVGEDRLGVEIN